MTDQIKQFSTVDKNGNPAKAALLPSGAVATILSPKAGSNPSLLEYDATENSSAEWADWGSNNDLPTQWREKIEKNTTAAPLIFKAVCLIFGGGVAYWRENRGDKITKDFSPIPEIDEFFENNEIDIWAIEQLMDFKYFGNIFSELIFNGVGSRVENIYHKEAEFSRISVQNKDLISEKMGYSGKWGEIKPKEIRLLDKSNLSNIRQQAIKGKKKLAVHCKFPAPGRTYYGVPPHFGLYRENGWLDYSNAIPVVMNQMINNTISLKYHIQIPYEYWESIYPEWKTYKDAKRQSLINEKLEEMDQWLKSAESAYSTFISHFATDPITRKPISGWKIEPIEDRIKKDEWIPGTQEADQQIARALNIDPSMAGIQAQGGKLGAGSGSDKRTGFSNSLLLSKAEQKIIFQPLQLISKINKWPKDVKFGFAHSSPTTLDQNKSGIENII